MRIMIISLASTLFLVACAKEIVLAPGEQLAQRSVQIVNGRDSPMLVFRASTTKDRKWGDDRLGHRIMQTGQAFTINFRDNGLCMYDFLAEFDDGEKIDQRKINICEISQWVAE